MIMVSPISTDSLFLIFSNIFEKRKPIKSQKNIPQNIILKKESTPSPMAHPVSSPCRIIHSITKKRASEVPSLNILSPSNIRARRRGAPTDLNIESTATGSVEEIRAQNRRQTKKGICNPRNGKIKKRILAISIVDISISISGKLPIVLQFLKSSL